MATEYMLSFAANDINRKLGKIDSLAEKSELPTKLSDLDNDTGFTTEAYVNDYAQPKGDYAIKGELPTELPNPNVLTFTGALDETYDGTTPVTVDIPNIEIEEFGTVSNGVVVESGATILVTYADEEKSMSASIYDGKNGNGIYHASNAITSGSELNGYDLRVNRDNITTNGRAIQIGDFIIYENTMYVVESIGGSPNYYVRCNICTNLKGEAGEDGNGIKTAVLNDDYTLTLTLDDGTNYTTPSIRGAVGATGSPGKDGVNGKDGTSVTVKSVSESTADGGSNVVIFSDGNTVTVKNGSKGTQGEQGESGLPGLSFYKAVAEPTVVSASVYNLSKAYVVSQDGRSIQIGDFILVSESLNLYHISYISGQTLRLGFVGTLKGTDGKTPVKGTDYYTAADKTEMVGLVKAAMPTLTVTGIDEDGVSHTWLMYGVSQ